MSEKSDPSTIPAAVSAPAPDPAPPTQEEPIFIIQVGSRVTFLIQDGPIKQVGVNGCQIDDVIKWVRDFIQKVDGEFPHIQNKRALKGLNNALYCLNLRTRDRELRGVEGYNIK